MSQPAAVVLPLFGPLSAADSAALLPLLRPRCYEAGHKVLKRGDATTEVFMVAEGQMRISVCAANGRELAFRVAGPEGMSVEIGALDDCRRSIKRYGKTLICRSAILGEIAETADVG